ncbi:MAG: pantetheine-phosphate adenylyltransferase [Thermodesulfovibrionales bacterium]|nr:pantetheine-phosphate adenylyltransferase [Thermodesulfovibrionales bacterium]
MERTAIYPGTFDPFTNGHLDLVTRGCKMFDKIIIGVGENPNKKQLFSIEERVSLIRDAVKGLEDVTVEPFDTLLVDFARTRGIDALMRGLRAVSDFEYELQMALMNRKLAQEVETVFLMPSLRYIFLSSTIIKEAAEYGGDVSSLVPDNVARALREKFASKG